MSGRVGTSWKGPRKLRNDDRVTLEAVGRGALLLAFAWAVLVVFLMAGAAWGLA